MGAFSVTSRPLGDVHFTPVLFSFLSAPSHSLVSEKPNVPLESAAPTGPSIPPLTEHPEAVSTKRHAAAWFLLWCISARTHRRVCAFSKLLTTQWLNLTMASDAGIDGGFSSTSMAYTPFPVWIGLTS